MSKIVTAVLVTVALALMAAQVQAQTVIDAATPVAGDLSNGAGQTLVIDFANSQTLTVSGDVSNAGTVYAVSSNPLVTSGIISSVNVYNFAGASVTSIVPAGGIPGLPNIYASLANLTFNAQTSFQNEGIVAANSLSVNAPSIVNASFSGGAGANPIIQSINNLNLAATAITNQGQIASQLANINIIAATVNNTATIVAAANLAISGVSTGLLVNNLGGMINAGGQLSFDVPSTPVSPLLEVYDGILQGKKVPTSRRRSKVGQAELHDYIHAARDAKHR